MQRDTRPCAVQRRSATVCLDVDRVTWSDEGGDIGDRVVDEVPVAVTLDGLVVNNYQVRETNRGTEVTVSTTAGHHTLTITV